MNMALLWQVMKVETDSGGSFTIRYAFASQRGYYPDGKPTTNTQVVILLPHINTQVVRVLSRCYPDGKGTIQMTCLYYPDGKGIIQMV